VEEKWEEGDEDWLLAEAHGLSSHQKGEN